MKKLFLPLMLLMACETQADICKGLIRKVCEAKMYDEFPPDVIAKSGDEMLKRCQGYVEGLKEVAGISDDQCVKDMTRVLQSYQIP